MRIATWTVSPVSRATCGWVPCSMPACRSSLASCRRRASTCPGSRSARPRAALLAGRPSSSSSRSSTHPCAARRRRTAVFAGRAPWLACRNPRGGAAIPQIGSAPHVHRRLADIRSDRRARRLPDMVAPTASRSIADRLRRGQGARLRPARGALPRGGGRDTIVDVVCACSARTCSASNRCTARPSRSVPAPCARRTASCRCPRRAPDLLIGMPSARAGCAASAPPDGAALLAVLVRRVRTTTRLVRPRAATARAPRTIRRCRTCYGSRFGEVRPTGSMASLLELQCTSTRRPGSGRLAAR